MSFVADWLNRISRGGAIIGGIFLIAAMLIIISNVVGRFVHLVIPGSYEIFELLMVPPISFALFYAALKNSHVIVSLIVSRFPPRQKTAAEMMASLLSFAIWGLIAWSSIQMVFENGMQETSDILEIPFLPFRLVWIICLFLLCLTYLLYSYQAFRRLLKK